MKIKDDNEKKSSWRKNCCEKLHHILPAYSNRKLSISLVINVVLIVFIVCVSVYYVVYTDSGITTVTYIASPLLYKSNIEPRAVISALNGFKSENIGVPGHVLRGWLATPEYITIDIKNNDFQKLSQQRDTALSQGIWEGSDESVPATIRYRNEIIKVKVTLKGNSIEHWGTDAWSLKVKTEGESRLFGMREFSIQKPWTRNYLTEWVFHRFLSYEKIPCLQFSFVDVQVNGKAMGIYLIEEAPADRLLDAKGYPPGPIFHMNNDVWSIGNDDFVGTIPIDLYNEGNYNSSQVLGEQARKGSDLFEAFRIGTLSTKEAFDLRTLATYMALCDVTGNYNGNYPSNIMPYYNPITSKLELIGRDAKGREPIKNIFYLDNRQFNQIISKDPDFVRLYVHELERVSEPEYLDRFFSEIQTDFEENLSIMYKENPLYHFPREMYYQNQKIIRLTIYPNRCQYSYLENVTPDGVINIEAGAAQPMPVEVIGLRLNGTLLPQTTGPKILPGNKAEEFMTYQTLTFRLPEGQERVASTDNLSLDCRVYGTTPVRSEPVIGKARLSEWSPGEDIVRRLPNVEQFSWLSKNDENLTISIQPGTWEIKKDLIIPKGYTVISPNGGGTRLDLNQGAMILSYSPLWLSGSEDLPFEVISSDGTGQGILLLNVDNESLFSYVRISNLSVPNRNGWKLPASVTFYRSPVIIDHCEIGKGRIHGSLLSIVRGDAKILNSLFIQSEGDLLNLAYSSLEVRDTRFLGPAISGITGTGSKMKILNSRFQGPFGIGIRGMRGSNITIENSYVSTSRVAGTAEDGSGLTLMDCNIDSGVIGLAAFKNTPGYGPGTIVAENVHIENMQIPYLSEKGSYINTGRFNVPASELQVFPQIKEIAGISQ